MAKSLRLLMAAMRGDCARKRRGLRPLKVLLLILISILAAVPASAYTLRTTSSGELVKWQSDEIDVYLSASLELLGPADRVYPSIEDAFETWIYEAGIALQVNFIYAECEPGYYSMPRNSNCIYADSHSSNTNEDAGANASITYSQQKGEIFDGDIAFYPGAGNWKFEDNEDGLDFKHVALHEIGHFLGLGHSQLKESIMYPTVNLHSSKVSSLADTDIRGALVLYGAGNLDEQAACQFSPSYSSVRPAEKSLLSLLVSLFLT